MRCSPLSSASKLAVEIIPPQQVDHLFPKGEERFPVIAYAGIENGEVIGYGGLAWRLGVCWLWLDGVEHGSHKHARRLVREARRMLSLAVKYGDRDVFAWRDDHPKSEKLLSLLGFERGRGTVGGREFWRWRAPD